MMNGNVDGGGSKKSGNALQAKELKLIILIIILLMALMTAVEVNIMSISFSVVEIRTLDADFGRQILFLTPSRVESVGKESILCLETTTTR